MDKWKYYAVTHASHVIYNPLSEDKVDEIVDLLGLTSEARVLDIACGKGEFLRRSALKWHCTAVGVDISPFFVAAARENLRRASLSDRVDVIEADAKRFSSPHRFDVAVCLGASWIWAGFDGTLRSLRAFTKPGGLVVAGEPFWRRQPSVDHLASMNVSSDLYGTHYSNVEIGTKTGMQPLHAIVSSHDDWDRYEGYQWLNAEQHATQNPDDPDGPEILARTRADRDRYLRWGREELGWAVYIFRKDGD